MRIGVIVVAFGLSVLAALFSDVDPPSTLARCPNPGPNRPDDSLHYFGGGYYGTPEIPGGVYARIQVKQPWVEPPAQLTNFSSAWTMLVGPAMPGYSRPYAQVGWIEWPFSGRNNFYTWTDRYGTQVQPQIWGPLGVPFPLNSYHYYTTLHDVNIPGKFSFYVDGQFWDLKYLDWQPNEAELFGEIDTAASQLGGGYGYPMYANDIAVWYYGTWQRPTLNVSATNWGYAGVFRYGSGSGQTFAIWDQYCVD